MGDAAFEKWPFWAIGCDGCPQEDFCGRVWLVLTRSLLVSKRIFIKRLWFWSCNILGFLIFHCVLLDGYRTLFILTYKRWSEDLIRIHHFRGFIIETLIILQTIWFLRGGCTPLLKSVTWTRYSYQTLFRWLFLGVLRVDIILVVVDRDYFLLWVLRSVLILMVFYYWHDIDNSALWIPLFQGWQFDFLIRWLWDCHDFITCMSELLTCFSNILCSRYWRCVSYARIFVQEIPPFCIPKFETSECTWRQRRRNPICLLSKRFYKHLL